MNDFRLDPRLENDCFDLGRLDVSRLLLMNNSLFPWFILVPETDVFELFELEKDVQRAVLDEINRVSSVLKQGFAAEKINVAAIGNVVRQLHVHVIGRSEKDPVWPGVVWGSGKTRPYDDDGRDRVITILKQHEILRDQGR